MSLTKISYYPGINRKALWLIRVSGLNKYCIIYISAFVILYYWLQVVIVKTHILNDKKVKGVKTM